jgi:hypothetical protein
MHGTRKIEGTLLNNYKKTAPLILLIILIVYILNVNNHYRLFLNEDEKLRNDMESCRRDYQIVDGFIRKVFKHADLIGRKMPFFDEHVLRDNYKIIAIKRTNFNVPTNNNIVRIVNNIKSEKSDIKIFSISDSTTVNAKNMHVSSDEVSFVDQPCIFLLGDQNQILSAFSLDGKESLEELQLISRYIMKIVPEQLIKRTK